MKRKAGLIGFIVVVILILVVAQRTSRRSQSNSTPVLPVMPSAPMNPLPKPVPPPPPSSAKHMIPVAKPAPPAPVKPRPVAPSPTVPSPSPITAPVAPPVLPPVVPALPVVSEPMDWHGLDTAVKHAGQVVIRNDHQWISFWAEHHPDEAAPDVDFTRSMAVGVFSGPRPADQFGVRITGIRTTEKAVHVDYQELIPPVGTVAINVTVYPYAIRVIPRSALPVKFDSLPPKQQ